MICSSSTGILCFDKESAEKSFPIFKEAGFDAVDYGFFTVFDKTGGGIYKTPVARSRVFDLPEDEFLAYFEPIKAAAKKNGIAFGQCHAPFSSYRFNVSDEDNEYIASCIKKSIAAAGYLESPYIVIHPVNFPFESTATKQEIFDKNVEFYSQFIDDLKKHKVVACLENMWIKRKQKIYESTCNDYAEVNRYIELLNRKAGAECFGFCLDTGHSVLTSANIRQAIETLGSNLKALHLHEVNGIDDNHAMPFTFNNAVDWDNIMTALRDFGYKGTINFEASNSWMYFPQPLWPDAIRMLGAIGKYFCEKYFSEE